MKGIMFTEPMFHKVASGEKTQTRRIVKPQPVNVFYGTPVAKCDNQTGMTDIRSRYKPGETLCLKEPYRITHIDNIWFMNYLYISEKIELNISAGNNKIKTILIQQEKAKSGWCNKLFMPEWCTRYFIEITGVRIEQLQDISDEDCLKEGAVGWLLDWVGKEAADYVQDFEYWVNDSLLGGHSQEISYCEKCGEKEVRKTKRKAKKAGVTEEDLNNDIFLDGGWLQEDEHAVFCAGCGKRLQFSMCGDLEEYLKERDYELNKYAAYIIAQYDEEDLEKIQGLPRKAYAALIDSINGKGTWDRNPYVFVYDFILTTK
jgi:hypothetical protein